MTGDVYVTDFACVMHVMEGATYGMFRTRMETTVVVESLFWF